MKHAAKQLFNIDLSFDEISNGSQRIEIRPGNNQDFLNIILNDTSTQPPTELLRFAKSYGFKNIQNLVRKINPKQRKTFRPKARNDFNAMTPLPYHFVEVMACPSGCINGGGQLKPEGGTKWTSSENSSNTTTKQWLQLTENIYQSTSKQDPSQNIHVASLYK